jgi:photosynthetic reaction center cytochrome c subunit
MNAGTQRVLALLVIAAGVLAAGCERPPPESVQHGYRGLAMGELYNPRTLAAQAAGNVAPAATPAADPGGPPASSVFKNVQVLNDLSIGEFTRLMVAMTQWVAPEQGCAYCHKAGEDMSADALYTKVVARKMLQMTRSINSEHTNHVGTTGVTCFTCHRGNNVPSEVWFRNPGPTTVKGTTAGNRAGQNWPAPQVGLTSLPFDPFTPFLDERQQIRVISTSALPTDNRHSIKQTEWTYALMMHMSDALGVNCTFCHNSRSFASWDASTPQRATAYYGIQTVRAVNEKFLNPLQSVYPPHRLGPEGDAPKANCATCHQGAYKPLYGAQMAKDYPELLQTKAPLAPPTPAPEVTATLAIVYFAVASPDVHSELPASLGPMVALLKSNPRAQATISGYHSATGDAAANHELAKTRATNVQAILLAQGIPVSRIILVKPIVEQANIAGEDPKARRVEVAVR